MLTTLEGEEMHYAILALYCAFCTMVLQQNLQFLEHCKLPLSLNGFY